jgi:phosphatidylinositol-3-phosphatase
MHGYDKNLRRISRCAVLAALISLSSLLAAEWAVAEYAPLAVDPGVDGAAISIATARPGPVSAAMPESSAPPQFTNVFIVVEENREYSKVVGNTSEMPYLNGLIATYGLATQYYANTHPSLPNYLWLISGGSDGVTSNACDITVSDDNVVRELKAARRSWKAYLEDLPYAGYSGCSSGRYVKKHNPFAYLLDVRESAAQRKHMVPFSQFAKDLAGERLPQYGFIVPNLLHDAHDGTLAQADSWLRTNIEPLLRIPAFQPGGRALLIIVFDEGTSNANGGGRVAWLAISPKAKPGYRSTVLYQHESTLRLMLTGLDVHNLPGAAATAANMDEFFVP